MGLPAAIQAQIDAGEAAAQMMYGEPPNGDTQQDQQTAPPETQQVTPNEQRSDEAEDRKWEAKFHTLQGKYNAEVPRLTEQIRETQGALRTALQEIERLKSLPQSAAPSPQNSLITDSDREAFGEDLINLAERISRQQVEQYASQNRQLVQKIEQLEGRLGNMSESVELNDLERCKYNLTQMVPNWETVNTEPEFLEWLDQADPVFGYRRQDALDDAINKRDAQKIAAVFSTWMNLVGYGKQQPNKSSKPGLESQVAPTRSRSTVAPTDQTKRTYTQAEVSAHYRKMIRGEYLTQQEADSMEAEINAASAEGRIV